MKFSNCKSLRVAVAKASIQTALWTAIIVLVGTVTYYFVAQAVAKNSVRKELSITAKKHIEQILPSLLLPEQRGALPHQLGRVRVQDDLTNVAFIESSAELPLKFSSCVLGPHTQYCRSDGGSEIGIIEPIIGGEQVFGYLFESKAVAGSQTFQSIFLVALVSLFIIAIFMFILYSLFRKIISKKVPHDIEALIKYVRELLLEKQTVQRPVFEFSDFAKLHDGIAKIFSNYKRTQNQAIVGHFASGVLHDIKTQLQSIVVASELAEEAAGDDAKYESRLENLQRVVQKNLPDLQVIIKSTLDANKEIHLSAQSINIETTITSAVEYTKAQDEFKKIKVDVENQSGKLIVSHDRAQAIRLFFNLIKNAFEAQSKVESQLKRVLIRIKDGSDSVQIRVEDPGPGIKGELDEIFDPFTTTKKHGVGLGLYNSQKIAAAHGWTIAAMSSEQLGGACFEVTIPKEINL